MDFFQILVVASLGPYAQTFFFIFEFFWGDFLRIFFVFVNMEPYGNQNLKTLLLRSLKSLLNPFKLFLNFPLSDPDKSAVLNF